MRGIHCVFLLLVFFSTVQSWDHFQFDITFLCELNDRTKYNVKIEWWEKDTMSAGQLLTKPFLTQPNTGRYSFTMAGAMNGDEIFSAGYKPVAYISHDCTSDRKRVDLVLTLTRLCEIGHTCHYRIITDITNKWGREDLAPTDFHHDNMDQFPDFP
ncbi:hypothetical protein L3Y34_005089 [Caenorhabditis briggsae]|uniref:Uncharacterized protein n=2 Tax=Caenorhabditis briggsae TaxID=6238 RepID=A0AAE9AIS6_CAEBR|nr:hypothetical protein L3Y34_005089 [Caenorhabditis briggsae]